MRDEEELPRGRSGSVVSRSRAGVHRTAGPWTETVHAFLRHLEDAGFDGAPRVVGMDGEGRDVLTYIDGEALADPNWHPGQPGRWPPYAQTDEALVAAGRLLRDFHEHATSFRPDKLVWKQYAWPVVLEGEIVCHGDVGRHNTVYRDGLPVAFIDWESIRPNLPILEFANAAWDFVPLAPESYFDVAGWNETPDVACRLALFAETYGAIDRREILWALQQTRQRHLEAMRYWTISAADAARTIHGIAGDLDWLSRNADDLGRYLR